MPLWDNLSDAQLIEKSKQGDAEAFGELYERHAVSIFRFLLAHLGDFHDAEDLTEDVFLRAWQAIPGYQERGLPFLAFVFRVARNVLTDHYRKNRRADVQLPWETKNLTGIYATMDQQLSSVLEYPKLYEAMSLLRKDYAMVLTLRFLSGLSPEETAAVMKRSLSAVRVLQHRALSALRNLMDKDAR